MTSRAYVARSPRSHYDVILIVTSFATELATPTVTDVRTYEHTDTFPRLIYKDIKKTVFSHMALCGGLQQHHSRVKFQGHAPSVGLLKCDFSYSCVAADKISTDLVRRAENLVCYIMVYTACILSRVVFVHFSL